MGPQEEEPTAHLGKAVTTMRSTTSRSEEEEQVTADDDDDNIVKRKSRKSDSEALSSSEDEAEQKSSGTPADLLELLSRVEGSQGDNGKDKDYKNIMTNESVDATKDNHLAEAEYEEQASSSSPQHLSLHNNEEKESYDDNGDDNPFTASTTSSELHHVENLSNLRKLRTSTVTPKSQNKTSGAASSISFQDFDDIEDVEAYPIEQHLPSSRPSLLDQSHQHKSFSQRVSSSVRSHVHFHYSSLFGNDYSAKEGTFVMMAGVIMAFNSGFVNGSCMSGFLTGPDNRQVVAGFAGPFGSSSLALAQQEWSVFGFQSNLILSYMAGAVIAGFLTPRARPYCMEPNYGPTFLVGGIMLFMASILAAFERDPHYIFYLTAGANGLQNGIASIYSSNLIRCSMTGAITDIALAVGQVMRGNTAPLPKAIVLSLIVFGFWVGGIASFFMTRHYLSLTLFFNAALFWLVGIALVVFLVKNIGLSTRDAILGTWEWKKTLKKISKDMPSEHSGHGTPETTRKERKLFRMFDEIDDDGNGHIEHDELLRYLMRMDKKTTARTVKMLMRCADQDDDGVISRAEWEQMVQKLYS